MSLFTRFRFGAAVPTGSPAPARRDWLKRLGVLLGGALLARPSLSAAASPQSGGSAPLLGEIILAAYNFAPKGYAVCAGQLLPINQNQALFAILGTTYGGNGQTTFALPDLRGRSPIGAGQAPGLSDHTLGEAAGQEAHTLSYAEMPSHLHTAPVTSAAATSSSPAGAVPAKASGTDSNGRPLTLKLYAAGSPLTGESGQQEAVNATGGNQPANNRPPYLGLNFYIALSGVFPSRD